jgi:steroid delta-isomerase-like uncharacterized protein
MTGEPIDRVAATDRTTGEMTREEIATFFNRRQEAFDNLDAAAIAAGYTDDCTVESPMAGTHQGRAAVERVYRAVFDAFLDHTVRTETLVIDGSRVAQVISLEGTDIGGFMGLPPTGKGFRVPAVFLFEFKDRHIARERRIYDFTGLLLQIGVLKAKPV